MTKRAASAKPKKPEQVPSITEEDIKKVFDEAKQGIIMKIDAQIKQARRADVVMALWKQATNYVMDQTRAVYDVVDSVEYNLGEVKKAIDKTSFDDLIAEDYKDPISDLIVYCDDDTDIKHVFVYAHVFEAIRPYGEQLEQLRYQIMGNLEAIKNAN